MKIAETVPSKKPRYPMIEYLKLCLATTLINQVKAKVKIEE